MSLFIPSPMRFYKICALLGTVVILADVGLSWARIQAFENSVTQVFESIVRTQMEIDGLEQELTHVDKVISQAMQITSGAEKVTAHSTWGTPIRSGASCERHGGHRLRATLRKR